MDEVAGGFMSLRGDTETVGFAERFWIKVQLEYKLKKGGVTGKRKIDEVADRQVHTPVYYRLLTLYFSADIPL